MTKPEAEDRRAIKQLEAQFDSLRRRAAREHGEERVRPGPDTNNGGTGMNAFTARGHDLLLREPCRPTSSSCGSGSESDRLKNRVFREFYSERDVVYEERRRSHRVHPHRQVRGVASTPVFWDSSPYSWPVDRLAERRRRDHARRRRDEYYGLYYAPQNLTAILVGDFDPATALAMAEKYLGSIPAGTRPRPR